MKKFIFYSVNVKDECILYILYSEHTVIANIHQNRQKHFITQ